MVKSQEMSPNQRRQSLWIAGVMAISAGATLVTFGRWQSLALSLLSGAVVLLICARIYAQIAHLSWLHPVAEVPLLGFAFFGFVIRTWMGSPSSDHYVGAFSVDTGDYAHALTLIGAGYLLAMLFAAAYPAVRSLRRGTPSPRYQVKRETPRHTGTTRGLFLGAGIFISVRTYYQFAHGIGVVDHVSSVPLQGALYHIGHTGVLLLLGSSTWFSATSSRRWSLPTFIFLAYSVLGTMAGKRGAFLHALIVVALAFLASRPRVRVRTIIRAVPLLPIGVVAYWLAGMNRSRTGLGASLGDSALLGGLLYRLGGAPMLAPVVRLKGSTSVDALWSDYEATVNSVVFGLPAGHRMGHDITIWGFGYLSAGTLGVILASVAAAVAVILLSLLWRRQTTVVGAGALSVGSLIWLQTLMGGNLYIRMTASIALLVMALLLRTAMFVIGRHPASLVGEQLLGPDAVSLQHRTGLRSLS